MTIKIEPLSSDLIFSRRDVLKSGGALIVGFSLAGAAGPAAAARGDAAGPPDPNAVDTWIAVHADNSATIYFENANWGRGTPPGCCRSRAKSSIST